MQTPLDFVRGSQAIEWKNGTRLLVADPQYIDEGVIPVGATWARNPIPPIASWRAGCGVRASHNASALDPAGQPCQQFGSPCSDAGGWAQTAGSTDPSDVMGACSGNWIDGLIVDEVTIPTGINPGAYVLGA
jgi:hypothetical protein